MTGKNTFGTAPYGMMNEEVNGYLVFPFDEVKAV
jgi:hypothetical protein